MRRLVLLISKIIALSTIFNALPSIAQSAENSPDEGRIAPCSQRYTPVWSFHDAPLRKGMPAREALECWSPDTDLGVWGEQNLSIRTARGQYPVFIRVEYPEGSINPRNREAPIGGTGFYGTQLGTPGAQAACLRYAVRFEEDFDFARGGKLPGLYGGSGASGCTPAEGDDGFSVRFMWRANGDGEAYAYLPGSNTRCGLSIGRGTWRFAPSRWTVLEQEVVVNRPGAEDGILRVWVDGEPVINETNVNYRTTDSLAVRGIFFSTFFGGSDPSWASPRDQHVDFADFAVFMD